ncbi:echinoderm microtubule-associated protein-like 2 isoform X2 [Hemiscyllium ocellatum]|uniref:echinoderm microtubule-associated protein-like 2 isoform X2 n=1 Tax=Hemiscyllium ocellatum TaxID=170820 RepID=UPI0029670C18|nr:echinoderm microtubule-associated protein-like 2 isoform X2 [Hemiscyllium ocellatum]
MDSLEDNVSGVSEWDHQDHRLSVLEQRVQQQDDEITLLKSALADALRRICFYDQHFSLLEVNQPGNHSLLNAFPTLGPTGRSTATRTQSLSSAYDLLRHSGDTSTSCTHTKERKVKGIEALHQAHVQQPRGQAALTVRSWPQDSESTVRHSLAPPCLSHCRPHPHLIQPLTSVQQAAGDYKQLLCCQENTKSPGAGPPAQATQLPNNDEPSCQLCEGGTFPNHSGEPGGQPPFEPNAQWPAKLSTCHLKDESRLQSAETYSCTQGQHTFPGTETNAALETALGNAHPNPLLPSHVPASQNIIQQYSQCPTETQSDRSPDHQDKPSRQSPDEQVLCPVASLDMYGSQPIAETIPQSQIRPEAAPLNGSLSQPSNEVHVTAINADVSHYLQQEHSTPLAASPDSAEVVQAAEGTPSAASLDASQTSSQTQNEPVTKLLPCLQECPDELTSQPQGPHSVSQASQQSVRNCVPSSSPVVTNSALNKKVLLRRCSTSDKLGAMRDRATENGKPKLVRKSASSLNLMTKSRNVDSRTKELIQSPGAVSRRGVYNQEGISIKMFLRGRPITMYVPSKLQNTEDLKAELPVEKLKLDWVYGYRGRDSRYNLHLLSSGEIVYFIACVVVLFNIEERAQRHYLKHTDCVRCLAVHPDKVRIASGQAAGVDKDGKLLLPFVHIWDSVTLQTLQHIGLGSFERGVATLAFSKADSGAFLCVVDDSTEHIMSIWDCAKGTKQVEIKTTNEAVFEVEFHPTDSSSVVTCGKSHVYFWTWTGSCLTKKQGIFGKYKKPKFIQCFVFLRNGDVLTGDSEGNILLWGKAAADIKTLGKGAKETYQIAKQTKAHEGSIFTLCIMRDGTLLSGGGKDRKIIHWNLSLTTDQETEIPDRFGAVRTIVEGQADDLLIGTTRNAILRGSFTEPFTPIVQGHTDELWGLATHPFQDLFLTCAHDKQVCLWNQEQHMLEWSKTLEETGLCADFHCSGTMVAVGLQTGRWVVLDCETQNLVSSTVDGNEQLSVVRYSPDGNFLAIGSHDNYIYLYTVSENGRKYNRFGRCMGHSSFITHLDWSQDSHFIMSNSGDYEILYWDIGAGCKLLRNRYECKDLEWVSYTCVLGFHVFGVWPDGSDGTDINALCRSHNERTVAVADDFCKVHLFQYPCAKPKAPSHVYGGHGSHVTNVRFTHSDTHLISTGGKDTTVMQWRMMNSSLERSTSISSTSVSSLDIPSGGNV